MMINPTGEEILDFCNRDGEGVISTVRHFLELQANETSGDMLTFDEWANENRVGGIHVRKAWNAARIGMIPAKNAMNELQANETSGDMLTFEEFDKMADDHMTYSSRDLLNAARQGMVPAKNTITLPDESEWPEWARSIRIEFSKSDCADSMSYIKDIFRTKPKPIKMIKAEALERLAGIMGRDVEIVE